MRYGEACGLQWRFQSTLPTRGSDMTRQSVSDWTGGFQSTLPTRGSDVLTCAMPTCTVPISIHAPHEGERPLRLSMHIAASTYFNPRSPRGGATYLSRAKARARLISIHAPHEGERPFADVEQIRAKRFQSTLPTRGSDSRIAKYKYPALDFNPRSP